MRLALLLLLGACAGPAAPKASEMGGLDSRQTRDPRIEELDRQIAEQLAEIDLAAPTDEEMAIASWQGPELPTGSIVEACEAPPTAIGCDDVCTTGDLICDNAAAICELAGEMPGDDWAAGRCAAGKESCDRARDKCCSC